MCQRGTHLAPKSRVGLCSQPLKTSRKWEKFIQRCLAGAGEEFDGFFIAPVSNIGGELVVSGVARGAKIRKGEV